MNKKNIFKLNYFEVQKTLFLYKQLENIVFKTNSIENKYKQKFIRKILTLSNNWIEKVINELIEWDKQINKINLVIHLKKRIEENRFMKKVILFNKIIGK